MSTRTKSFAIVVAICILASIFALYNFAVKNSDQRVQAVKVDRKISDYNANFIRGSQESINDPEKIYIYEVFASWCIPCRESVPIVLDFVEANPKIGLAGIAYRDVEFEIDRFMEEYGSFETVLKSNGSLESAFGIFSVPKTIFVKDNIVLYQVIGEVTPKILQETLRLIEGELSSS